ncbi:hypothetical protein Pmani_020911 [Petrolisthes manimaculis]|uniref:Uncharacterized protein n=1 Tax=Petrolisthes manimaculis TaxID=1843537 RepID=A0AAE1U2L1_9EUCA|nr:hypothetical protein Pmani_020911 [Petrolisthes manimaculis]
MAPLHIVSQQDAVDFVNSAPTQERVRGLKKDELLLVAQVLELTSETTNVFPLVNVICHHMFGINLYSFCDESEGLSVGEWPSQENNASRTVIQSSTFTDTEQAKSVHELRVLQIKMQMQEKQLQMQFQMQSQEKEREAERLEREAERDRQLKLQMQEKSLQLEKYKIDHGSHSRSCTDESSGSHLEQYRLVPKFDETHVTEFFQKFEKIALGNKWPRERWSTLAHRTHGSEKDFSTVTNRVLLAQHGC